MWWVSVGVCVGGGGFGVGGQCVVGEVFPVVTWCKQGVHKNSVEMRGWLFNLRTSNGSSVLPLHRQGHIETRTSTAPTRL